MSAVWTLATAGARAHRAAFAGTALTLAAAGAVLSVVGVLLETGFRGGAGVDGGLLVTLASSYAGTALVVVLLVVSATVTLALRGRRRELALLRTVGATRRQVRQQVAREVLLVAALAVPLGALPGTLLSDRLAPLLADAGVLAPGAGLALSPLPAVGALALLLPTALLAGRLATRETLRTAPAAAVRESAVEPPTVGTTRLVVALVLAASGLSAAFTPVVVPGTIGGATAATSAFLLLGALALAGPLLVGWAFGRVPESREPAARLAVHNLRGFSRRLTGVVVPLALALATGTVQTTVDDTVVEAAHRQLTAAVGTDHVVTGDVAGLGTPLADVPAEVRTDSDDLPDSLVWEDTALRTVPASTPTSVLDPDVTRGALADLATPGTVAVSSDTAFELSVGLGDQVTVRLDGVERSLDVVAVYERGLGLGGFLTDPGTLGDPVPHTALVDGPVGAAPGRTVQGVDEYAAAATSAAGADQRLSTVLLLLLLVFVGLAAANALVLTTAGRRAELALLARTGTTRRQLLRMSAVEAALTGLLAWVVGTLVVVPAVLGVTGGLLGPAVPVVDWATYGVLSGLVLATAFGATLAPAYAVTRPARAASR